MLHASMLNTSCYTAFIIELVVIDRQTDGTYKASIAGNKIPPYTGGEGSPDVGQFSKVLPCSFD